MSWFSRIQEQAANPVGVERRHGVAGPELGAQLERHPALLLFDDTAEPRVEAARGRLHFPRAGIFEQIGAHAVTAVDAAFHASDRALELAAGVGDHLLESGDRLAQPLERNAQFARDRSGDLTHHGKPFELQQLGFRFELGALRFELLGPDGGEFVVGADLAGDQIHHHPDRDRAADREESDDDDLTCPIGKSRGCAAADGDSEGIPGERPDGLDPPFLLIRPARTKRRGAVVGENRSKIRLCDAAFGSARLLRITREHASIDTDLMNVRHVLAKNRPPVARPSRE